MQWSQHTFITLETRFQIESSISSRNHVFIVIIVKGWFAYYFWKFRLKKFIEIKNAQALNKNLVKPSQSMPSGLAT